MPIPVQNGDLSLGLARQFGIQGRYSLQLDDVVVPTVSVDEQPYIEKPAAGAFPLQGAVGAFGSGSFEAPGDGQTLVVIDAVSVVALPALGLSLPESVVLHLTPTGGVGTDHGYWRDQRLGGFPLALWDLHPPGPLMTFDPLLVIPADGTWTELGVTLPAEPRVASKWALIFQCLNADTAAGISILWRELIPRRSNAPK